MADSTEKNQMATATYQPLILAVEIWNSSEDSNTLRPADSIASIGSSVSKQVVERVVEEMAPIILNREDIAESNGHGDLHGFNAVMGIPVITEQRVKSCVVLALHCSPEAMGAFEIWSRDDRDELGLNGAVFAGLSRFASISQHVRFPRGSGLPGQSWEDREAKLITGLGTSPNFMRASGARAGGLDIGLALPIMTTEHVINSVILMLSSTATPIAQVFEIWEIDSQSATCNAGTYPEGSELSGEAAELKFAIGEGIVGRAWATGQAQATDQLSTLDSKRIESLKNAGLTSAVAIPTYIGKLLKSVFVMFN